MTWNDQSLREMPLHAITQKLGMDGLHRRFEIEISRFDNTERADLSRALRLAERLHRTDQRANGEPYLGHVLRVAIRIASDNHYRVSDVHVLLAAVLHDTVEDHALELAGGAPLDARAAALTASAVTSGPAVPVLSARSAHRRRSLTWIGTGSTSGTWNSPSPTSRGHESSRPPT